MLIRAKVATLKTTRAMRELTLLVVLRSTRLVPLDGELAAPSGPTEPPVVVPLRGEFPTPPSGARAVMLLVVRGKDLVECREWLDITCVSKFCCSSLVPAQCLVEMGTVGDG